MSQTDRQTARQTDRLYLYFFPLQVQSEGYLGDFLSLELMEGSLLLKYETGGGLGSNKMVQIGAGLNDGYPHHVAISLQGAVASISVNTSLFGSTSPPPSSLPPQFTSSLFVCGVGMTTTATSFHLQSTTSLVATIRSFQVNHTLLQYSAVLEQTRAVLGFPLSSRCSPNPCSNGGQCVDLWTRYSCSCTLGFTGERCEIYNLAHFPANASLDLQVPVVTNISFGFSTLQQSGVLMTITSVSHSHTLNKISVNTSGK